MKQSVNNYEFEQAFRAAGRIDQFSYEGLKVLFDALEQYESDAGEEIELDVIALCCEYSEDTPEEIAAQYDITLDEDDEDVMQQVVDYLNDHTMVCGTTDTAIVYQQF